MDWGDPIKTAKRKIPKISEEEIFINKFTGLNTFGPHADLLKSEFRTLVNYDNYGSYIKSRRGSQNFVNSTLLGINVQAHAVFDAGDAEYALVQQSTADAHIIQSIKLEAGNIWKPSISKSTGQLVVYPGGGKADMIVSNGKVYIFHPGGNYILEFDSVLEQFKSRKMGLPAPQINNIITTSSSTLDGKRVYGVELVYKDTTVTPNVDIVVSGPNRAMAVTNPLLGEGKLAYTEEGELLGFQVYIDPILNDGTNIDPAISPENDNWTHIRLHRSLDITTATNATQGLDGESEITGWPDELYRVQEMDKATFLATWDGATYSFAVDDVLDDDRPFPLDIITKDRLELVPIPPATTGAFQKNRIWASGILAVPGPGGTVEVPEIESKVFYSPETDTKYSESMNVLNAIESDPGDGQKMIKLIALKEDLICIKEGKTGRIANSDPDRGWTIEDETIGISNKEFAQFVPGVGICARVNDQADFRIFGFDLKWRSTFSGQQISRPIRELISKFDADDIDFLYINGKLMVSGGKAVLLVLGTEQQAGWSTYEYPLNGLSEAVFTFAEGTRAVAISSGRTVVEIEAIDQTTKDYIDTDYTTDTGLDIQIDTELTTWKFQELKGRALLEERFLSIVAKASSQLMAVPYVNGKLWGNIFGLLLNPLEYPDLALRETEYQGYEEFRAIGNYIHYVITTPAPCTIYSIMLNTLIQRNNIRPGFDPFELLAAATVAPPWTNPTDTIEETGTAPDTITETGTAPDTITEDGA